MKACSHLWEYRAELFLKWEKFRIKIDEKIKTHISCSLNFFRKSCRLWDNVENYVGGREATDGNIAASCMVDKQSYMLART
jgi:hypothetical protein